MWHQHSFSSITQAFNPEILASYVRWQNGGENAQRQLSFQWALSIFIQYKMQIYRSQWRWLPQAYLAHSVNWVTFTSSSSAHRFAVHICLPNRRESGVAGEKWVLSFIICNPLQILFIWSKLGRWGVQDTWYIYGKDKCKKCFHGEN
jgi:hypothetical protein